MPDTATDSLRELLAEALPKVVPFTFYHYSTPPTKCPPLFKPPPHRVPERTYCESHTLAVSITPKDNSSAHVPEELLILAIEVLIYSTKNLTTIFVSKADSTGYIALLALPRSQSGSPLKAICGTFVSWLARARQREGKKLVVSLFARAQDQYLFPGSVDNSHKHVLDDRGLIKWWCRVLDPIMDRYSAEEDKKTLSERLADSKDGVTSNGHSPQKDITAKGYLVIPGYEPYDTMRYVAASATSGPRRWVAAHPLLQIAPYRTAPPRCLVPHFPDDPKARFLDELDEELPDARRDDGSQAGTPSRSNGQWKSVKTLDQFWEMMAFRQECSSGRIVGFIWVVITPPEPSIPEEEEDTEVPESQESHTTNSKPAATVSSPASKQSSRKIRRKKVNTDYGPIPLILPRIKSSVSNMSSDSAGAISAKKLPPAHTAYYTWPTTSRGALILSSSAYARAHEVLLQQNFATRTAASRSTKRWKDEVAILGGAEDWAWTVVGEKEGAAVTNASDNGPPPVTLIGVRKKRKPEAEASSTNANVNVLGEGLVKKKAKLEEPAPAAPTATINTLGDGLVRRKPKN
ncbi:hypothetical protein M011DRAFT_481908 [Sporormia fimetaria CBS 119925]|uniref:histone acetyltransferase n=1 Tax=Sporormia fimetaria CBS 119925 TaxID=1340428 RepID=A0A6A6UVB9_9PLEO|nr:hypothetical protein M011DRAFT_481908 [Sporormia fimetaria CBS 119925]